MESDTDQTSTFGSDGLLLERHLENIFIRDLNFASLEQELDHFCPFEAMGMVWHEIRHGNFLAYLMDPLRPHGFGSEILRTFLFAALQNAPDYDIQLRPLDVHLLELGGAEVRREWSRIDLLVILKSIKTVVAIELKIDALQGEDQLQRYRKVVGDTWRKEDEWNHILVFLTKSDEPPADDSWVPLRLHELAPELEALVNRSEQTAIGTQMLRSYMEMLRRHHLPNERLEELSLKLWSRHGAALEFLMNNRPDQTGSLMMELAGTIDDLVAQIGKSGIKLVRDQDDTNILRFAVEKWDSLPGFKSAKWTDTKRLILLEIKRSQRGIAAVAHLGPSDQQFRQKYVDLLKDQQSSKKTRANDVWMCIAKRDLHEGTTEEIDLDKTLTYIKKGFATFTKEVFSQFDPLLSVLNPVIDTKGNNRGA